MAFRISSARPRRGIGSRSEHRWGVRPAGWLRPLTASPPQPRLHPHRLGGRMRRAEGSGKEQGFIDGRPVSDANADPSLRRTLSRSPSAPLLAARPFDLPGSSGDSRRTSRLWCCSPPQLLHRQQDLERRMSRAKGLEQESSGSVPGRPARAATADRCLQPALSRKPSASPKTPGTACSASRA